MADSPASSDLSDPPSGESEAEEQGSTAVPSSRPSVDITHTPDDHLAPPSKRRKTGLSTLATSDRPPSSQAGPDEDDALSISSDGYSSAPGSPTHDEYALRDEAQTACLWKDCQFGEATNNDELVKHVQSTHCATGGPKKTKYVCEWGECQRKTSNHPSGYALKAHMRSHTKEKPYYCALPECDKAFTRSDALAKHMRTVHEPEAPAKSTTANDPTPPGKKSIKLKLTNGNGNASANRVGPEGTPKGAPSDMPRSLDPNLPTRTDTNTIAAHTHDENGDPIPASHQTHPNDNIAYIPAHHPITGQPGFMITYPPDIHFTAWESSIAADQLMRLLRRQLHWAQKEQAELKRECAGLERTRGEEFQLKEVLLDGVLEAELARGEAEGLLGNVDGRTRGLMERDAEMGKGISWAGGTPKWRRTRHSTNDSNFNHAGDAASHSDDDMPDAADAPPELETPIDRPPSPQRTPSPPPTGHSGGFDGDADPYDNYLAGRMAEYEERERLRSSQNTPQKVRKDRQGVREREEVREREADAVGALVGMSGK